jgi:hypothetical protein
VSARRWAEFLLPDAIGVQLDWLRDVVRGDDGFVAQLARSPTARRLLNRTMYRRLEIPVPARVSLNPHQQWLLAGREQQLRLARQLGIEALHGLIRTTIDGRSVAVLRTEIGEEGYGRALAQPGLEVDGLDRSAFVAAVTRGRLTAYIVSVGAAVLETTTRSGDPFCGVRMRFAFSPECWRSRPRGIRVDGAQLARRIAELEAQ